MKGKFCMVDAELVEVRQWLLKARRDLESAKVLFDRELNDTSVYHCQQAAEKSLKAYLAWHKGCGKNKSSNPACL